MKDEQLLRIEQYISEAMSGEERLSFERELESDPALQEAYKLSLEINEHLLEEYSEYEIPDNEFTQALKEELRSEASKNIKETIAKVGVEHAKKSITPRKKNYGWVAAIAAAFIVGLGLTFFTGSDESEVYDDFYAVADLPSVIKRGDTDSDLEQGVLAFQKEEYPEALQHFEVYRSKGLHLNDAVYLYSGMSHVALGDFDASHADFDILIASNSLDASKGLWFKALAYLKAEDIEKVKQLLKKILLDSSNFNFTKAQDLLEELE